MINRHRIKQGRAAHRSRLRRRQLSRRHLAREVLEPRVVLDAHLGPQLIGINPNEGGIFAHGDTAQNELNVAPTDLTFRFDGNQMLDLDTLAEGIRITRSVDREFGNVDDEVIEPGHIGFGDTEFVVVARFAETLPDDLYRIEIFGYDDPERGITALRNVDGDPFVPLDPADPERPVEVVDFELELGAKVIAVVPQPVRFESGAKTQHLDQIDVYFDDADLFPDDIESSDVVNREFYQLFLTQESGTPFDDLRFLPVPDGVEADAARKMVTLTFSAPLHELPGVDGEGTFRLRVGTDENPLNSAPTEITVGSDPGASPSGAESLGTLSGHTALQLNQVISAVGIGLDYPGGVEEPGHRDISDQHHHTIGLPADFDPGIAQITYDLAKLEPYGVDAFGNPVHTSISPEQEVRIREIFDFYGELLGIDFVEVPNGGNLRIAVGDMFPAGGTVSGPGDVLGVAFGNMMIMDGAETWYDGFGYDLANVLPNAGPNFSFFGVALHEIGHLLGLGHNYELPSQTTMGSTPELLSPGAEWVFPGDHDVVHGVHMYRPDARDVDMYRFEVGPGDSGELTVETFAERLRNSSNVDTHLSLFREDPDTGMLHPVASNDDYFSNDSLINLRLSNEDSDSPAVYYIGVTATGNDDYDPNVAGTGGGANSQGAYELRVDFHSDAAATVMADSEGTAFDGDRDGNPGEAYNFWFRAADPAPASPDEPRTLFVDKSYVGPHDGSLERPYRHIDDALAAAKPKDVVRILGNLGGDGDLSTPHDAAGYEIGENESLQEILSDGKNLIVPAGVTVMIDSGAILKMFGSRIGIGSSDNGIDRSQGAIQVLGTPEVPVYMTSYSDRELGSNSNPVGDAPEPGDWGGVEIRNDVDRAQGRIDLERQGIFLNYVNHADIRYGGGRVEVDTNTRTVHPLHLSAARAELSYNTITLSQSAAVSADPNSFEETTFAEPRYQQGVPFAPDYGRVGPDISGNLLLDNQTNGLLVRIDTLPGNRIKQLDVSGRFDDTDIVHVLNENLLVRGNPGGSIREITQTSPDVELVSATASATADEGLESGTYHYRLTFVDIHGAESVASDEIGPVNASAASNEVHFTRLPAANRDFVGRRLWRSDDGGATYQLVGELDRSSTSYTDALQKPKDAVLPNPTGTTLSRIRPDGRLAVDPGIIVKSDEARIEAGFGADIIAEGVDGRPVVFTSRRDDRYGAGGTFDTNDNADSTGSAGDWGGIYMSPFSRLSLDYALVAFGGGVTSLEGTFSAFNAVELHQAEGRIAHSTFEFNAGGVGGQADANREGRGPNEGAVIFVAGSQPVIVDNVIRDNTDADSAVISINANALTATARSDFGRQTGRTGRVAAPPGNAGPLVFDNALGNNTLNGMRIRGEILTTESVWDDVDIVHILQSEVIVPDLHTYGGLRLESAVDQSLVVKLDGADAGLTATGRPLDIDDRIGGRVQVLGMPGFPVVMTSLNDDTVGAGFDPQGRALVDTDNNGGSAGSPGDWRGIRLEPKSHDRNVATVLERERSIDGGRDLNAQPNTAQPLGILAPSEFDGDENRRLGFSVQGMIASPSDVDVYSFSGTAGTQVWIDLDRTDPSLDAVVELIDSSGNILVLSDSSRNDEFAQDVFFRDPSLPDGHALPMRRATDALLNSDGSYKDLYSTSANDPGFRVVLPGSTGTERNYLIRVRSSNLSGPNPGNILDPGQVRRGVTSGEYELQVRLQETDEFAGSTVQYADIRYATNGIEAIGLPAHSPLGGEQSASNGVQTVDLGNLPNSDRGAISVAGFLDNGNTNSFSFSMLRDSIQSGGNSVRVAATLDIDYADGLGRPDTQMWLYWQPNASAPAELVMLGTGSNVSDDRPDPLEGSDLDDLSRGSVGTRDAFIGTKELRSNGIYTVVVSSNEVVAQELQQFLLANVSTDVGLVRLEPSEATERIADDRFEWVGSEIPTVDSAPVATQVAFNANGSNTVPWLLGDVAMFTSINSGNNTDVRIINPYTGRYDALVRNNLGNAQRFEAMAMLPDGRLVAYSAPNGNQTDGNTGNYLEINTGTGAVNNIGSSGIQTFHGFIDGNGNPDVRQARNNNADVGFGMEFHALSYFASTGNHNNGYLYGVASRGEGVTEFTGVTVDGDGNATGLVPNQPATNYVYRLNPDNGQAINPTGVGDRGGDRRAIAGTAGTNKVEQLRIDTDNRVTGLAQVGSVLYAVSDAGELFSIGVSQGNGNLGGAVTIRDDADPIVDQNGNPVRFTALTAGPRNVEGGIYANLLFGTAEDGSMYVIDPIGNGPGAQPGDLRYVLAGGDASANLGTANHGVAFSTLDVNLWHHTNNRNNDAGHGFPETNDGWRDGADARNGGGSLYFGFENPNNNRQNQQGDWDGVLHPGINNSYNFPGGAHGAVDSNPISLSGYTAEDLPYLYFNYFLESEGADSNSIGSNMRDSFRVYVTGDDGRWALVGTNNSIDSNSLAQIQGRNYLNGTEEVDFQVSNFTTPVQREFTQEVFDNSGWRQARIPIGQWAGEENIRIRLEFNTAGEPRPDQSELRAVPGLELDDASTFTVTTRNPITNLINGAEQFEFDHGLVLDIPSGSSIPLGSTITQTIGGVPQTLIRFVDHLPTSPEEVVYSPDESADTIANRVYNALQAQGFTVNRSPEAGNLVSVPDADPAATYNANGISGSIITGRPGRANPSSGNVLVPITLDATAVQVRESIQEALRATFNVPGQETNSATFPTVGNEFTSADIRFYDAFISSSNTPMDIINGELAGGGLPGSNFGVYDTGVGGLGSDNYHTKARGRGTDNGHEGIYIDDVVIGFAERGEIVTGASGNFSSVSNPFFEPNFPGIATEEITDGAYQLEVRLSAEYDGGATVNDMSLLGGRTFDTNDRLTDAIALDVQYDGSMIPDGATFSLSNGIDVVTFEFDDTRLSTGVESGRIRVPFNSSMTSREIATQIRDAINRPSARSVLGITATDAGGSASGLATSTRVDLFGPAAANVHGGKNFEVQNRNNATLFNFFQTIEFGTETRNWLSGLPLGSDVGDANRHRDQGQVILASNIVRDSLEYGILVDANTRAPGPRDGEGPRREGVQPEPGHPIHLPTRNQDRLLPGVVVTNNILAANGDGGIRLSGDAQPGGQPLAPAPFARVVNNTIYGVGGGDVGIRVDENASPTLLNNVVANAGVGIQVAGASPVIGGTLYAGNGNNVQGTSLGDFARVVGAAEPLFVDPNGGNYYPEAGSQIVDSSTDALQERSDFRVVKAAVGIAPSPILAPQRDITGQRRSTASGGSAGGSAIDRGALDRSDSTGLLAQLLLPADNDTNGLDLDDALTSVQRVGEDAVLDTFQFLLVDALGTGPDPATVTPESVILTQNGRPLTEGVHYTFGYNASSRTVQLKSLSGIWRPDAVYEITLNNRDRLAIQAPSGDEITDGDQLTLVEPDGTPVVLEYDTGYVVEIPQTFALSVESTVGVGGFEDGDRFTISDGTLSLTFEIDVNGFGVSDPAHIPVVVDPGAVRSEVATALLDALTNVPADPAATGGVTPAEFLDLRPSLTSSREVHLGTRDGHDVVIPTALQSHLGLTGQPGTVTDGETIRYTTAAGTTVTFEFDSDTDVADGNIPVDISQADTADEIAQRLAEAAAAETELGLPLARGLEGGRAYLGGRPGDVLNTAVSAATQQGEPGVTGALQLTMPAGGLNDITDGDTFSISDGTTTRTFEFSYDSAYDTANVRIRLHGGESVEDIASLVAQEIRDGGIGLDNAQVDPDDPTAVLLGETADYTVDLGTSLLEVDGIPGGAVAVDVIPGEAFTAEATAANLVAAVTRTASNATFPFDGRAFTPGGGRVYLSGLADISGTNVDVVDVPALRDFAGNRLQANRRTGETAFTIILGDEPGLDFGTAAVAETPLANDGARHVVLGPNQLLPGQTPLALGTGTPTTEDDAPDADPNDGVDLSEAIFNSTYNEALPAQVTVTATAAGLVDAWIDWNNDGDFGDPGEQVLTNVAVVTGDNLVEIRTPSTAVAGVDLAARFRISKTGNLAASGIAVGGEVEDYTIQVRPGVPPIAEDDQLQFAEDSGPFQLDAPGILGNDTDADGNPLEVHPDDVDHYTDFELYDSHGVLAGILDVDADGSVRFVPELDYNTEFDPDDPDDDPTLTFTYRALDSNGVPSIDDATVTLTITAVNDDPIAEDDGVFETLENRPSELQELAIPFADLLANDSWGPTSSVPEIAENENYQTLSIEPSDVAPLNSNDDSEIEVDISSVESINGEVVVTPQHHGVGIAKFVYRTTDSEGAKSNWATVTVRVLPINDPPEIDPDWHPAGGYEIDEDANGAVIIDTATIEASDAPGPSRSSGIAVDELNDQTLDVVDVRVPDSLVDLYPDQTTADAAAWIDEATGEIRFTPPENYFGAFFIEYVVRDVQDDPSNPVSPFPISYRPDGSGGFEAFPDERRAVGTLPVTILAVNDPPQVGNTAWETLEDGATDFSDTEDVYSIADMIAFFEATTGPGAEDGEFEDDELFFALGESDAVIQDGSVNGTTTAGGAFTITESGGQYAFHYDAPADYFGDDSLTLWLVDRPNDPNTEPDELRTEFTVNITVRPVNDPPVMDADGNADEFDMLEDGVLMVDPADLIANDWVGPENEDGTPETSNAAGNRPQSFDMSSFAASGAFQIENGPAGTIVDYDATTGMLRVQPPADFYSVDGDGDDLGTAITIRYTVRDDGQSFTDSFTGPEDDPLHPEMRGTIVVHVYAVNDAPVTRSHVRDVVEDESETIPAGDLILTQPTVDDAPTGSEIDSTDPDLGGFDHAGAGENLGVDDTKQAGEQLDQRVKILPPEPGVSGYLEIGPGEFQISTTRGGTVRFVDTDGDLDNGIEELRYTPPANFASTDPSERDSFTYTIEDNGRTFSSDGSGGFVAEDDPLRTTGTVFLDVTPVNDPPTISLGADLSLREDDTRFNSDGTPGLISIDNYAVGVRPGPASAEDESGQPVTLSVSVDNEELFASENGQPVIRFEGDPHDQNRRLVMQLAENVSGTAIVTVIASDGVAAPDEGVTERTFTVSVSSVNDPPEFEIEPEFGPGPGTFEFAVDEDSGLFSGTFASNILPGPQAGVDGDGNPFSYPDEASQSVTFQVDIDPADRDLFNLVPRIANDGTLRFSPAANASTRGRDPVVLTIRAVDNGSGQSPHNNTSEEVTLSLTINEVNDAPNVRNDSYSASEDQVLDISAPGLLDNDTDIDGDSLTVSQLGSTGQLFGTSLQGAAVTLNADGSFRYDPRDVAVIKALDTGESLVDTFTYHATDGRGAESEEPATVTITVTGVNDAPTAVDDIRRVAPGRATVLRPLDNDFDVDNQIDPSSVQISRAPQNGSLEVRSDGTVVYTPRSGFTGNDFFEYTVADAAGERSQPARFDLEVQTAPLAIADRVNTVRDQAVAADVLANDEPGDSPLDPESVEITEQPQNGSVAVQADGTILYTPADGFRGTDTFRYRVADTNGVESASARVTVRVTGSAGENPDGPRDVNGSGEVSPIDALLVINHLNRGAETDVQTLVDQGEISVQTGPFLDVDGNGTIQPLDALLVINELNRRATGGEAEADALPAPSDVTGTTADDASTADQEPTDRQPLAATPAARSGQDGGRRGQALLVELDELVDVLADDQSDEDEESLDQFWSRFEGLE